MTQQSDVQLPPGVPGWRIARRQKMINAAIKLLKRQPYEQIHIRDVAIAANVALGTLYRYFGSKEHLYAEALLTWASPMAEAPPAGATTPELRLRAKAHLSLKVVERYPNFYTLQLALSASTEPIVRELIAEWGRRGRSWFAVEIGDGVGQRSHVLAQMLVAVMASMLTSATVQGGTFDEARHVCDSFIDLIKDEL